MAATTLQIVIVAAVLVCLVWMAVRPGKRRGARRPSSDNSWSGGATYDIADSGQHHGWGGHDSGSGHSASSGDGGGGSDSGGGGSDGGSSSD
jgi:uncharacterized membrane protein YgcG